MSSDCNLRVFSFLSITGWMGLQSRSQAEVFMEEEGKRRRDNACTRIRW